MKYKAISLFTDLQDDNYLYEAGDSYPRKGLVPSKKRLAELLGSENKRSEPVIEPDLDNMTVAELQEFSELIGKSLNSKKKADMIQELKQS